MEELNERIEIAQIYYHEQVSYVPINSMFYLLKSSFYLIRLSLLLLIAYCRSNKRPSPAPTCCGVVMDTQVWSITSTSK